MSDKQLRHQKKETKTKPFFKNCLFWVGVGISPIIIFAIFLGYQYVVQMPKAKQAQAQLEIEFKAIAPLPNANIVRYEPSHKTSQASVDATYLTNASPNDIFTYYDGQLRQHGWQPSGTGGVTDWGKDLGGKIADYCKGDYSAELQYAGQQANYGWTYALNMSWGFADCKTKAK